MSQTLVQKWQPKPANNPDSTELVKEGKKSVAEYIERKVATVQYLLENIHKKTQSIQVESEDTLVTSFCILCSRCLVLPVGRPVCQSETVYDLVEESI